MTARAKGFDPDWDPKADDYNNTSYDPQYADESNSSYVNLDHSRLYITNIPKALNEDGLQAAFSKFGTLVECFVSKDPMRHYGLVGFETPGEAKLAMMKLNRTEPLRLNISIAHKKRTYNQNNRDRDNRDSRDSRDNSRGYDRQRDREWRGSRDDSASVGSRSSFRKQEDLANGDNMEEIIEDVDVGLNSSLDPDVNLELENLKLEHLKLQEAQLLCKHRMLLLKQAERKASSSSRQILPNGRIVIRNVDKSETVRDGDASFGAGAGDSRVGNCVACGERATAFCGGCGVTPYCGAPCQRRDWTARHRNLCHNLKRLSGGATAATAKAEPAPELDSSIPLAPPLRRPRSPDATRRERRDDDSGSDRAPPRKNFGPPGSATPAANARGGYNNARNGPTRAPQDDRNQYGRNDRTSRDNEGRGDARSNNRSDCRGGQNRSDNAGSNISNRLNNRYGNRGGAESRTPAAQEEEEWGGSAKPQSKPAEPLPTPELKPKSPQVQLSAPKFLPKTPKVPKELPKEVKPAPAPVGVAAVPVKPVVPKNSIIDSLQVNSTFTLSVDTPGAACGLDAGFVCLAVNEDHEHQYMQLLESFEPCCLKSEAFKPQPGDLFAYLNPSDAGWYRARCLKADSAALIDASKIVQLKPTDDCRRVHKDYVDIPEFSCVLKADNVKASDSLLCTVKSKSGGTTSISMMDAAGAAVGEGTIQRWAPKVEYPAPAQTSAPVKPAAVVNTPVSAAPSAIPEVPRPPVTNKSKVIVIDATEPSRVFVRPAELEKQREFDDIVTEVALYGASATPLKEPPTIGQTVVAKFTDGIHYRALCKRYSSKQKKYLLEYIEYGNVAVGFLEELYPCPENLNLTARPTLASHVKLDMSQKAFTPAALDYLDRLKNDAVELVLTIPSGERSAPTGSAIRLVMQNGEDVTRTVDNLCTPEWQKLLARGGDVLEVPTLSFSNIQYVDLPEAPVDLEITDSQTLGSGLISGYARGAPHAARAFALTPQLTEYCNSELCKDPYLPNAEELCIAKCPIRNQWLRAVMLEQREGAGGTDATLLFFDYGNVSSQSVSLLRKMMPEFLQGIPSAVCSLVIKDFPEKPTESQLNAAKAFLKLNDKGVGMVRVNSFTKQESEEYLIELPELIRTMNRV